FRRRPRSARSRQRLPRQPRLLEGLPAPPGEVRRDPRPGAALLAQRRLLPGADGPPQGRDLRRPAGGAASRAEGRCVASRGGLSFSEATASAATATRSRSSGAPRGSRPAVLGAVVQYDVNIAPDVLEEAVEQVEPPQQWVDAPARRRAAIDVREGRLGLGVAGEEP